MVNEEPKATTNSQHRQIAIERLVATEIRLTPTEEHTNTSDAIKLPLEHIPELGVAFSSLPEAFLTVTTTVKPPRCFNQLTSSAIHSIPQFSRISKTTAGLWDPTEIRLTALLKLAFI